jgi:hypothetical protein
MNWMAMGPMSPAKIARRASSPNHPRRDDLGGLASLRQNINIVAQRQRCRQNGRFAAIYGLCCTGETKSASDALLFADTRIDLPPLDAAG